MMHEFLSENRGELIERCRMKVAQRPSPRASEAELDHGITLFLDQIIKTLKAEELDHSGEVLRMSGPSGGADAVASEMGAAAKEHGRELLQHGFTIDQVVHDYGDLCQAVTELALEQNSPISNAEFRTLNSCLDNVIAVAATEFNAERDNAFAEKDAQAHVRLGFFAHELRNHLNSAMLAVTAIKEGAVGMTGATGAVLDRSLVALRTLIDRSLSEARTAGGMPTRNRLFSVAELIVEMQLSASLEARVRGCTLNVSYVDTNLAVDADRELILSALGNLLQNAFKFTQPPGEVQLRVTAQGDRVLIEVEDRCGGLPSGDVVDMFRPYSQSGADRSGLGLGLSLSRRSVEANEGTLTARDLPGVGCVFTIDLPRHAMPLSPHRPWPALHENRGPVSPVSRA
ncbi:MAG: HAMP domain-containing histidine kinase [Verrucomicrobiota bacterium]|nr:HAMP domain-containing histidine kinase [Verrucomicrobiota bacterium]